MLAKLLGILRAILRAFGLTEDDEASISDTQRVGDIQAHSALKRPIELPYRLRENFLSPAEFYFFEMLQSVVSERTVLWAKVGLRDLFRVTSNDPSDKTGDMNRIDRKHVDFVMCDRLTMRPLVAIELDDRSHLRADRQARDAFVDQVFEAAGLPLLHIPVRRTYDMADIADQLAPYLNSSVATKPLEPVRTRPIIASEQMPPCPKCGSAMILRTAKNGPNAGQQFWGCSKYPACRGMVAHNG